MSYKVRERDWPRDEFGPEYVFEVFDPSNDEVIGWVVVDNTWRSPDRVGKGGTAMYPSCDLEITARKGRTMTWKQVFCSLIGEVTQYKPWGGGKGGIPYDSSKPDAEMRLRKWARALNEAQIIPQKYIFGLDVGLKEWATRAVVEELGDPRASTGKPENMGGIPYDELGITGFGLVVVTPIMCGYRCIDFDNLNTTIAMQGFGAVGQGFMKWFAHIPSYARPRVVAISDVGGAVYLKDGFDPEESVRVVEKHGSIVYYSGAKKIPLGTELFLNVDILLLAYKEDQITMDNQHDVKAKVILQGANMGITRDAGKVLHTRDILTLPDFVVNSGASSIVYVEYDGGSIEDGIQYVKKVLPHNARIILDEMKRFPRLTPRELALNIAESEVVKARPPRDTERALLT